MKPPLMPRAPGKLPADQDPHQGAKPPSPCPSERLPDLTHLQVLVTRPQAQAKPLCDAIQAAGGTPLLFPTLEIVAIEPNPRLQHALGQLDATAVGAAPVALPRYDIVIFVSANAVRLEICEWLHAFDPREHPKILAIGPGTAKALALQNIQVQEQDLPDAFNSEGLLKVPILQALDPVHNEHGGHNAHKARGEGGRNNADAHGPQNKPLSILLFKGEGGREFLAHELARRGAVLTVVDVYTRRCPVVHAESIQALTLKKIDFILCTSLEGLQNLYQLLCPLYKDWFLQQHLVVISEKMRALALEWGFAAQKIRQAEDAGEKSLLRALLRN